MGFRLYRILKKLKRKKEIIRYGTALSSCWKILSTKRVGNIFCTWDPFYSSKRFDVEGAKTHVLRRKNGNRRRKRLIWHNRFRKENRENERKTNKWGIRIITWKNERFE